jgi:hypothetical protein
MLLLTRDMEYGIWISHPYVSRPRLNNKDIEYEILISLWNNDSLLSCCYIVSVAP